MDKKNTTLIKMMKKTILVHVKTEELDSEPVLNMIKELEGLGYNVIKVPSEPINFIEILE